MRSIAAMVALVVECEVEELGKNERYLILKCGPVLLASHGMGMPSVSILLHEVHIRTTSTLCLLCGP
jgi:uridine phosphorylase